jgi:putative heme iron utilization protein
VAGDPLEGARIMLSGVAEEGGGEDVTVLRRRYLNVHPSAEVFVDFKDFSFFRIRPKAAHLVAGFGRIVDLAADRIVTDLTGAEALLAAEQDAIAQMNADRRDALNLYATKLLDAEAAEWRCTGCDPGGLDLQSGGKILRLDFPERVAGPGELRRMLVTLAAEARAKS